jgi:hypothetical protein
MTQDSWGFASKASIAVGDQHVAVDDWRQLETMIEQTRPESLTQ